MRVRTFDYEEAQRLRDDGMTLRAIAKRLGVSRQRINQVTRRGDWLAAGPLQDAINADLRRLGESRPPGHRGRWSGWRPLAERVAFFEQVTDTERCLRRILDQHHVSLRIADHYCARTGRHLSQLYPELYEETA